MVWKPDNFDGCLDWDCVALIMLVGACLGFVGGGFVGVVVMEVKKVKRVSWSRALGRLKGLWGDFIWDGF